MSNTFIYVACKFGYEKQCKSELLHANPNLRFSFSRPGFLTFKVINGGVNFSLLNRLTFVRTAGVNLGKFKFSGESVEGQIATDLQNLLRETPCQQIHFWNRNLGGNEDQVRLDFMHGDWSPSGQKLQNLATELKIPFNEQARVNDNVLNLVEVDPDEIWYGIHRVEAPQQSWPGGLIHFARPENTISRAYFKAKEAMLWSRFPFQPEQLCVEIGCAPGGSALALLESGLHVIGIDPADVDDEIAQNPNFQHIKKRGAEVRKKLLANAKWLLADSNVAPQYTLDIVEDIATHRQINLQGILITLKLLQPELAGRIEEYQQRVKQMGFQFVRTRQLAFNRNEICLAALRRKSILRFGKSK